MSPHLRYWLFQIPGLSLIGFMSLTLYTFALVESGTAILILVGWFCKDLLLYPFLFRMYSAGVNRDGVRGLIGLNGIVQTELNPEGYIRVRGELWRAVLSSPNSAPAADSESDLHESYSEKNPATGLNVLIEQKVPVGRPVYVWGALGMTLFVSLPPAVSDSSRY